MKKINKWGMVTLIIILGSALIELANIIFQIATNRLTGIQMLFEAIYFISLYLFLDYAHELRTEYKNIKKEK